MSSDSAILNVQFKLEREIIGKLRIRKFKFAYGFEVSEIMEKMGLKLNVNKDAEMLQTLHGDDTIVKLLNTWKFATLLILKLMSKEPRRGGYNTSSVWRRRSTTNRFRR